MLKKLFSNRLALSVLSGTVLFLAFERFGIVPLILLFPIFFNRLAESSSSFWQSFRWGFFTSFVIMLGGFYWVTYVLHEFGYLPWGVAGLLFLGFCGFGALNFPLFCGATTLIRNRLPNGFTPLWIVLGLPALFTVIEFFVPKLFPWYMGHCLYRLIPLIQISEITGTSILTFALYSLGGALAFAWTHRPSALRTLVFPLTLWLGIWVFGLIRMETYHPETRPFSVTLVQPNIGSLEKVEAESGSKTRVESVISRYVSLTAKALATQKSDLVLWPETAMPFQLDVNGGYQNLVKTFIKDQKTAFIIGGYQRGLKNPFKDHNSAFFYEPDGEGLKIQSYQKQILLAFGEYLPLGERFPILYRWFPQIADFERGTSRKPFLMKDGTRLGITICYEAIVPSFFRITAREGVNAMVNLTNDSWFGPTSEPYLHGSLTPFRAIETRVPLLRVTNTGVSFGVDAMGRMLGTTGRFTAESSKIDLQIPTKPPTTIYLRFGDWFVLLCMLAFAILFYRDVWQEMRKSRASISS